MDPHIRLVEFNRAQTARRTVFPDPSDRLARRRLPSGALTTGIAPRPVARRPQGPGVARVLPFASDVEALGCTARCQRPRIDRARPQARAPDFVVSTNWRGLLAVLADREASRFSLRVRSRVTALLFGSVAFGRPPTRPVLKHGPRSLARARVIGSLET